MVGGEEKAVVESKECYLSAYASEGMPTFDHLKFRTINLLAPASRLDPRFSCSPRVLMISVDLYLRMRITGRSEGLYISQFKLDNVPIYQCMNFLKKNKEEVFHNMLAARSLLYSS